MVFELWIEVVVFDGFGEDDGGFVFVFGCGFECGVYFVVVMVIVF